MINILIEDGMSIRKDGSETPGFGFTFWLNIKDALYVLNKSDVNVISSKGNGNFLNILYSSYNEYDTFIICFDSDISNRKLFKIMMDISEFVKDKQNCIVLDYICFEHIMLSFKSLFNWVGFNKTDDIDLIHDILYNIELNIQGKEYSNESLVEYCNIHKIKLDSYERVIKAIVADICKGINYFNIGKGTDTIGKCWFCNCCIHTGLVYEHSKCGLKENKLTKMGKILEIIQNTELENYLEQAGIKIEPLEYEVTAYLLRSLIDTGGVYNDSNP